MRNVAHRRRERNLRRQHAALHLMFHVEQKAAPDGDTPISVFRPRDLTPAQLLVLHNTQTNLLNSLFRE